MTSDQPFDPTAMPPPWVVFPRLRADDLPATQGAEEAWFDQIWRPFWSGLTDGMRHDYFEHWQATPDWRDAITFFFVTVPGLDD